MIVVGDTAYDSGLFNATVGGYDAFITKFNSVTGKMIFGVIAGTSSSDTYYCVATDSDNDIFVGGVSNGPLFGPNIYSGSEFVVAKYDGSSGANLWGIQVFNFHFNVFS